MFIAVVAKRVVIIVAVVLDVAHNCSSSNSRDDPSSLAIAAASKE